MTLELPHAGTFPFELAVRSGVLDGSVIPPIADIFGALGGLVQSADADADALVSTVTGNQLASR